MRICVYLIRMLSYQQFSDEELAGLLKKGDHAAYTIIFDRFYGLLFVHACKLLNNQDEAKDVVQELFEILWIRRETISLEHSLSSYLYSAVRNRIINRISHYQVEHKYISSLRGFIDRDTYFADYRVREREMRKMIEREISELPSKMREIFELSRRDYLSYKQIAVRLKISEQTVRTHVKKALRILKPKLSMIAYLFLFFNL
jgi:RNA polymerase sigma-70 factor (family 1)